MSNIDDVKMPVVKKRGRPSKMKSVSAAEKVDVNIKKSDIDIKKYDKVKKEKTRSKGAFINFLPVLITALIVGGGIYFWQKSSGERSLNDVKKDARNVRIELENKLNRIGDKLKGVEYENNELKTVNEKLKTKASLLSDAKKEYGSEEIGIEFEYPAIFGQVNFKISDSETGQIFRGDFSDNNNFIFGGSSQFKISSSTAVNTVLNTKGFIENKGKFYLSSDDDKINESYVFNPLEVFESNGNKIVLLNRDSFKIGGIAPESDGAATTSDEVATSSSYIFPDLESDKSVAAIIKLNGGAFKGVTFLDKNSDELSVDDFKGIISSIIVK